ncbi:myeloid-derived growth factor [Bombina bombina]|uniref:myeloid-derived growth factor n=1 Tax=Bombina bombina TaxID=8345 RepID=UPI00235A602E|nr:myeloid-derived growth factor [Bombina bombina]
MAAALVLGSVCLMMLLADICAQENTRTEEFDVRPGGLEHSYTLSLGDNSCIFTYAAQGGTNEKWQISVGLSEDKQLFSCSIWRPQGKSYLFFMSFKAEVTKGKIEYSEAYSQGATTSLSDIPLKSSEYDVADTTVSHRPGSFSSSLSKLLIVAKRSHDEL